MNREDFILSASAPQSTRMSAFTDAVMRKINTPEKPNVFFRLRHLHGPALAVAIIVAIIAVSGVAYAATILWHIVNEGVDGSGRQQYSIQGGESCEPNASASTLNRFELKSDAPKLSDDEVRKIIQAQCELNQVEQFVSKTWQPSGTHKEWRDGDAIYYTRSDVLGVVKSADAQRLQLESLGGPIDYTLSAGQKYQLYDAQFHKTSQLPFAGQVVFSVVKVSETYYKTPDANKRTNPHVLQLVAAIKMSLPIDYYTTYQGYITDVPTCIGNTDELCPNTASVDVYPRAGGEGAQNPQLKVKDGETGKQISGKVTSVTADIVVMQTRSGAEFTITLGEPGFEQFNSIYAKDYTDTDVHLKPGSTIMVMYYEAPNQHSKKIGPSQVTTVTLQLEGVSPKKSLKQY